MGYAGHLNAHPLFHLCAERTRCFSKALESHNLARGQDLFFCGEQAMKVIFLASCACLGYTTVDLTDMPEDLALTEEADMDTIQEGQWVREPVLWCSEWSHFGDLESLTECQVIMIDSEI